MLLTDSEIMDINQNAEFDSAIGYARKIESAVIEKLKAQEPDAWRTFDGEGGYDYRSYVDNEKYQAEFLARNPSSTYKNWVEPLYLHPLPPDDVVRDAARYKWLREHVGVFNDGYYRPWMPVGNSKIECADKLETDRAIDAAMKEMK